MTPNRYSEPERRNNLKSSTKIITSVLLVSTLAALAFCMLAIPIHPVHASSAGSLSLGTVAGAKNLSSCSGGQWLPSMNCVSAVLESCQNVDNLNFTYGYLVPSGTVKGIIVYFDGGDGITPAGEATEFDMLEYYLTQSYGVVEIQWSSAWEQTSIPNI